MENQFEQPQNTPESEESKILKRELQMFEASSTQMVGNPIVRIFDNLDHFGLSERIPGLAEHPDVKIYKGVLAEMIRLQGEILKILESKKNL